METSKTSGIEEVFPQRMKEYREVTGKSQKDIADQLGFNRVTYIYYESGNRQPGYTFLRDFSKLSGWSPSYLLGLSKYRTLTEESDAAQLHGDDKAVEAATIIRQTAKSLLDRYNAGENRIYNDYLEPLARVCESIDRTQEYLVYGENEFGRGRTWKNASQVDVDQALETYQAVATLLSSFLPEMPQRR